MLVENRTKMASKPSTDETVTNSELSLCIQNQSAMVQWPIPLSLAASSSPTPHHTVDEAQEDDFVGAASAVKALFTLPSNSSSQGGDCLVVHRIGNTLHFEDLSALNEIANNAMKKSRHRNQNMHRVEGNALINSRDGKQELVSLGLEGITPQNAMSRLLQALEPPDAILPPSNWLPPAPKASLHTYHWHFNDFRIVVGSDTEVYSSEGHPAVSLRTHESGSQWERCTALDAYLDNIMTNIPELALCLEMKGFIHGYKLMDTQSIPHVNTADVSKGPRLSLLDTPLFDAKDVELNAAMLMRFLQANCKVDGGTYFLQRESMISQQDMNIHGNDEVGGGSSQPVDCVRLYDLNAMSTTPTRKWKWLLAMMSYRFASRLRQSSKENLISKPKSFHESTHLRLRELLETCLGLLQELSDMGGTAHDMIKATAHDLIAESYLTVFEQENESSSSSSSSLSTSSSISSSSNSSSIVKDLNTSPTTRTTKSAHRTITTPIKNNASIDDNMPFALKRTYADETNDNGIKNGGVDNDDYDENETNTQMNDDGSDALLYGWPGEEKEEQFQKVEVSLLEKAQDHLSKGLKIIEKMLITSSTSDDECEEIVIDDKDNDNDDDEDDIDDTVRYEARKLRLRKIDLCLAIASRQMIAWRASSSISNLREAATTLLPLLPELQSSSSTSSSSVGMALAWFWEIGGKLARALAADRYKWVEMAGIHPSDIIGFLGEMDDLLRGRPPPTAPPYLHQVSFLDHSAWMFHRDLHSLPLANLGKPPSMASCHTASHALKKGSKGSGSGKKGKSLGEVGLSKKSTQKNEKEDDDDDIPTGEFVKHPTPLFLACSLCAARSLNAITSTFQESQISILIANNPTSTLRLLISRLGDACNEVGKALLSTVPQSTTYSENSMEEDKRLFAALVWFSRGLEHFRKLKDQSNSALLLCNIASSKKLVAGRLPMSGKHELWHPTDPAVSSSSSSAAAAVGVMELVECLLLEAIQDCYSSMECLKERDSDKETWDFIASELAMAYLTLGVRRRQSLLKSQELLPPSTHVSSGTAFKVAEPLEKAAQIYETLGDRAQLAATRYQAGTLWSRLWTRAAEPKKARERLSLALAHYEAAHTFYLQGNGGRTLVMIDLDLFDLYTAVHAASGAGNVECLEKALLCLLETHHAFKLGSSFEDVRNTNELKEMIRLSGLVAERLPKVLLQLAKTISSIVTSSSSSSSAFVTAGDTSLRSSTPGVSGTGFSSSESTTEESPPNGNRKDGSGLVDGYKSLYLASIRFKWPSSNNDSNEDMRSDLTAVGEFLQTDIHDVLVTLRKQHRR